MGQLRDSLSTAVPAGQIEALARLLGDTPEATGRAMAAAVPALLGALSNRAAHGGMDEVMALARPLLAHGDPLDRFTAALTDSSMRAGLMEEGHALASHLLGPTEGAMAAALTQATGTRAHTVAEVMKLAGPIGLGAAARLLGGNVTADRLAALLEGEQPALLAALPPALGPLVAASATEQSPLHGTPVEGAAGAAASAGRWLPWLAAAVVAIILVASFRTFETRGPAQPEKATTTPIITQAPVVLGRAELPDGSVLMLPEGSAALEIARALAGGNGADGSRSFRLGELGYSTTEDRLDAAGEEAVRAVASVLKAWPAVKMRVEAHGDGTGDPALSLAETAARAKAVADLLAADGVAPQNVAAAGLGSAQPIATVDTDEGRAQNRRTLIIITAA
jgi:outer membrane protein OmpA-like peptidoglycan-associated protein